MTLVSAGPIVEVTVTPASGFAPGFLSIEGAATPIFNQADPGTFSADLSGAEGIDDGQPLTITLLDGNAQTLVSFAVAGDGISLEDIGNGASGGVFSFAGARLFSRVCPVHVPRAKLCFTVPPVMFGKPVLNNVVTYDRAQPHIRLFEALGDLPMFRVRQTSLLLRNVPQCAPVLETVRGRYVVCYNRDKASRPS